jgi:hypothetical protein
MANAFASWRALNNQELRRQMAEILRGYEVRCTLCALFARLL